MSVFTPRHQLSARSRLASTPARPPSATANDAVLRTTAVISLLAIGAIHFLQIVPTWQATPLLGVAFLALIAAAVGVAVRLATHNDHRAWIASALVGGAAVGGYAFTRLFGTPLDRQDVGNWSCMLGLAALFVETAVLAISASGAITAGAFQERRPAAPIAPRAGGSGRGQPERGLTSPRQQAQGPPKGVTSMSGRPRRLQRYRRLGC